MDGRSRIIRERFSAAFSGGPIEAAYGSSFVSPVISGFSAAFSGGPIEASNITRASPERPAYFPLLLAAAPLKLSQPTGILLNARYIFRCF